VCGKAQGCDAFRNSQEEAYIKMLLHAVDDAAHGATEISIHSPDTRMCLFCHF